MNNNRSSRSRRFVTWSLAGCLALVAAVSTYQVLTPADGRSAGAKLSDFSDRVGRAASKLGMGFSSLIREREDWPAGGKVIPAVAKPPASRADLPAGMVATGKPAKSGAPAATRRPQLPDGMSRPGDPTTLMEKGAEQLDRIAAAAFITASPSEGTDKDGK